MCLKCLQGDRTHTHTPPQDQREQAKSAGKNYTFIWVTRRKIHLWSKSNVQNHNRPERFDPKHKPTREGTKTDQEKTTTPYKKMNGRLHTHTHTRTHTHRWNVWTEANFTWSFLFLFKYRFVGWYFFFPAIKKKRPKSAYVRGKRQKLSNKVVFPGGTWGRKQEAILREFTFLSTGLLAFYYLSAKVIFTF